MLLPMHVMVIPRPRPQQNPWLNDYRHTHDHHYALTYDIYMLSGITIIRKCLVNLKLTPTTPFILMQKIGNCRSITNEKKARAKHDLRQLIVCRIIRSIIGVCALVNICALIHIRALVDIGGLINICALINICGLIDVCTLVDIG
jgi:hypothetical protein